MSAPATFPLKFYQPILQDAASASLRPTATDISWIVALREEVRLSGGGGGGCDHVSDAIKARFGWARHSGAYTAGGGEVICPAHVWNLLPDGAVLDATADQFGEGYDVRILGPGEDDYPRYRPEFYQDFHPWCDEANARFSGMREHYARWDGEFDFEQCVRLRRERGDYWWVDDLEAARAYLTAQDAHLHRWQRDRHVGVSRWSYLDRIADRACEGTALTA